MLCGIISFALYLYFVFFVSLDLMHCLSLSLTWYEDVVLDGQLLVFWLAALTHVPTGLELVQSADVQHGLIHVAVDVVKVRKLAAYIGLYVGSLN